MEKSVDKCLSMGDSGEGVLAFVSAAVLVWRTKIKALHGEAFMLTRLWPLIVFADAICKGHLEHLPHEQYNRYVQAVAEAMAKFPLTYQQVASSKPGLDRQIRLLLTRASLLGQPLEAGLIARMIFSDLMQITRHHTMMQKLQVINVAKLAAKAAARDVLHLSVTSLAIRVQCRSWLACLREVVSVHTPWDYWHGTRPLIPFLSADTLQLLVRQRDWHSAGP